MGMECPMEGVENDYRLISGYFGGIEFGGFQEELLQITPNPPKTAMWLHEKIERERLEASTG